MALRTSLTCRRKLEARVIKYQSEYIKTEIIDRDI